jgi:hypothetical protein
LDAVDVQAVAGGRYVWHQPNYYDLPLFYCFMSLMLFLCCRLQTAGRHVWQQPHNYDLPQFYQLVAVAVLQTVEGRPVWHQLL